MGVKKEKIKKIPLGLIFIFCSVAGISLGLFFEDLTLQLTLSLGRIPDVPAEIFGIIDAMQPWFSRSLVGLIVGLISYVMVSLALSSFARNLLNELTSRLREKGLLSYKYKAVKKRKKLAAFQESIISLFDAYVDVLDSAHLERKKFEQALVKYTDPTVAKKLKYTGQEDTHIESKKRNVAVLFADIRGFTAMTETLQVEEVVGILNDYFSFANEAVIKNKGMVNKFIGDAVMAVFEDPPKYREDASATRHALNAALDMSDHFRMHFEKWKKKIPTPFHAGLGVGVVYGPAILGNLGSNDRMEYTAIGDTVNLSSRICSLAKSGEVRVLEENFEQVQEFFTGLAQQAVPVKGKTGLYTTYVVKRKHGV